LPVILPHHFFIEIKNGRNMITNKLNHLAGGMMKSEELQKYLEETGALLKGHFLLSSGRHSEHYLQCAKLLQRTDLAEKTGHALAELFRDVNADVVVSPAIGGLIIGHEVARSLGVPFVFTERENGLMTFRRGLGIEKGSRALAVEDVITTGGSVKEAMDVTEKHGAELVGVGSIIDRSGGKASFKVPYRSLLSVNFPTWAPDDLPEHLQNSVAVKPGSRPTP
jgi:orotate phosphoribosyltransferase